MQLLIGGLAKLEELPTNQELAGADSGEEKQLEVAAEGPAAEKLQPLPGGALGEFAGFVADEIKSATLSISCMSLLPKRAVPAISAAAARSSTANESKRVWCCELAATASLCISKMRASVSHKRRPACVCGGGTTFCKSATAFGVSVHS
ncbi:hypothetical protein FACS189481_0090 [Clostridia bacterium]|nr:hypothetical protein FACS189481_0090 [Clostridia bacterium]